MAIGDLVTGNWQMEFAGQHWGDGTNMDFVKLEGLAGTADVRSNDFARPRDHGVVAGIDLLGGRTITMDLEIGASSAADLETRLLSLQALGTTVSAVEQPLVFQLPGQVKRRVNARFRQRAMPMDISYEVGRLVAVTLQFFATDPRIYADAPGALTLNLPTASGGLGWPVGWPLGFSSSTSGLGVATNAGTFGTRPVVVFTGPLTSPSIQVTQGTTQTWFSTFDLQAGDTLTVDFEMRTVVLNGTASRYSFVPSGSAWWELPPGDSSLSMGAAAGSGSAAVAWRSAWT